MLTFVGCKCYLVPLSSCPRMWFAISRGVVFTRNRNRELPYGAGIALLLVSHLELFGDRLEFF